MSSELSLVLGDYVSNVVEEEHRQTDSVLDSVEKVASEISQVTSQVQAMGDHFRIRLQQTIEETRTKVEAHCQATLETALDQTRKIVREEVTRELQSKFDADTAQLSGQIQQARRESFMELKDFHDDMLKLESVIRDIRFKVAAKLQPPSTADQSLRAVELAS